MKTVLKEKFVTNILVTLDLSNSDLENYSDVIEYLEAIGFKRINNSTYCHPDYDYNIDATVSGIKSSLSTGNRVCITQCDEERGLLHTEFCYY